MFGEKRLSSGKIALGGGVGILIPLQCSELKATLVKINEIIPVLARHICDGSGDSTKQ